VLCLNQGTIRNCIIAFNYVGGGVCTDAGVGVAGSATISYSDMFGNTMGDFIPEPVPSTAGSACWREPPVLPGRQRRLSSGVASGRWDPRVSTWVETRTGAAASTR